MPRLRRDIPARRALAVIVPIVLLALPLSTAQAKTEKKTVPGVVLFEHGQNPSKVGNCGAVVFVQWVDVPNTVSATAYYPFKGKEYSKTGAPPFSDIVMLTGIEYAAPAGAHRLAGRGGLERGRKAERLLDTV